MAKIKRLIVNEKGSYHRVSTAGDTHTENWNVTAKCPQSPSASEEKDLEER